MAARISVDTDTWWHLRAGHWMVENQALLKVDHFSYTRAGAQWLYPGWLIEIPMYWIYLILGSGGLNLWTATMVTLAFIFVWQTLSGGPFLRALVVILAAAVSAVYWAARPYLVTFVLSAVYFWILEDFRWREKNRLLWLPILMIFWVNSHGGFVAGFFLWGVYFAYVLWEGMWNWLRGKSQRFTSQDGFGKRSNLLWLGGAGLLMILAACINPAGPAMILYPLKTVGIGALHDFIQEWQSPNFHDLNVQPFLWLLLLTFGAVGVSRRRLAMTDFLLVSGFTYLSLSAARNIALFALVVPAVLTRHAAPLIEAMSRRYGLRIAISDGSTGTQKRVNIALVFVLVVAAMLKAWYVFPSQVNEEYFQETLPVRAVAYLKEARPSGRLFNSYNWGGYLLWALPQYPVFVDGRTDLYDDGIISEWLKVVRAEEGWMAVLDQYGVHTVLIEKNLPLARTLSGEPEWNLVYSDSVSIIYVR